MYENRQGKKVTTPNSYLQIIDKLLITSKTTKLNTVQ